MSSKMMSRRKLIGGALAGVGGAFFLESYIRQSLAEKLLLPSLRRPVSLPVGTSELMQGLQQRLPWALARYGTAFADAPAGTKPWAVVTIKVVNHVCTPLVFKLGKRELNGQVTVDEKVRSVESFLGGSKAHLSAKGVDYLVDDPRLASLRFNKWFGNLLLTGSSDIVDNLSKPEVEYKRFPDNVAIQAGLGLVQEFSAKNHSLENFKVRNDEGDLAHYVEKYGIVNSPLGVTCFMMGDLYDFAEGRTDHNIVCKDVKGHEVALAEGFSVTQTVDTFEQSLHSVYGDDNVTLAFDRLIVEKPELRKAMFASREEIRSVIPSLRKSAELEVLRSASGGAANGGEQCTGKKIEGEAARREFLAQCEFVTSALKIPGRPLRNFSLFLNTSDLDGKNLDVPFNGGGTVGGQKSLTTVEGMRQLALGLNHLAQELSSQGNFIVQVISEGGRDQKLGDNKVSFGLVLAPKGAGGLSDVFYGNVEAYDQVSGPLVVAPGELTEDSKLVLPWTVDGLMSDEMVSAKKQKYTTVGDFQLGVAEFLAEKNGVEKPVAGQGYFVKLKRA